MSTALKVLVRHGEENYGPYTVGELNTMLDTGRFRPDNLAWIEGAPEWQTLHTVPGIRLLPPNPRACPADESDRMVLPAFLLAFFLGVFGVHRFYVGKTGSGLFMLFLTITLVGAVVSGIWATIDWIVIVCGGFRDDQGRVLRRWT